MSVVVDRPRSGPSRLRFLAFGLAVVLGAGALSARLFAIQVGGTGQYTALAATTRTVLEPLPVDARHGLRPAGPAARHQRRLVHAFGSGPWTCRSLAATRSSARSATLIGMDPAEINAAIDSNPGSRYDSVRVAQNVDPTVASFVAEAKDDLPGVEVVVETLRKYTTRLALRAHPRVHGPGQRRGAPGSSRPGLPARRPHRPCRRRGELRAAAARDLRPAGRRARRLGPRDPGPADGGAARRRQLARAHDRHARSRRRPRRPSPGA